MLTLLAVLAGMVATPSGWKWRDGTPASWWTITT